MTPDQFLPAVQQNGLMRAMTMVVLDQALDGAVRLRERGFPLPVAVNLFPESRRSRFATANRRRFVPPPPEPDLLVVEITKNSFWAT